MSSFVISALKSVKEQLSDNYSSYDLLTTLDTLMFNAVAPILKHTRFMERNLSLIVGWYVNAARRKVAALPTKEEFNSLVAALIVAQTDIDRKVIWKQLKLERTITFWLLQEWLAIMKPWAEAQVVDDQIKMQACCRKGCFISYDHVFQTVRKVDYWYAAAVDFKQQIMEKYMRLVMLETTNYAAFQRQHNPHLNIQTDDVAQNFILALSKAIDKCDVDKGTLTSYIKAWMQDARNTVNFSHEYGTAYSLPSSKKRDIARDLSNVNNISLSIDSEEVQELHSDHDTEADAVSRHVVNRVRRLSKAADPLGLGRLALRITEVLSPKELSLLEKLKEQNNA